MGNDIFLPIYFNGLYPLEEQDKIDLYSRNFYIDAVVFYSKKASEKTRKEIILGIKYLSCRIKHEDESNLVIRTWDIACSSMVAKEVFYRQTPNLVTEFKTEVANILNTRNEYLIERREKELKRLREEKENSKIIISSLLRDKKAESEIPINEHVKKHIDAPVLTEIDFEKLIIKINFKYRDQFKSIIKELRGSLINPQNANGKEFTAFASIFYNSGWISKKDITFIGWLKTFSEAYHRLKIPTYKETQVKVCIESLIRKAPFLDKIQKE